MQLIEFIIKFLGGALLMGVVIYLFKLFNKAKSADVAFSNSAEREAARKAQLDLEKGVEEARARYLAKRNEYMKARRNIINPRFLINADKLKNDSNNQGDK